MNYPHVILVLFPVNRAADASAMASAVFGGDDPGANFPVRLSVSGDEPATHLAGTGVITDAQLQMVSGAMPAWASFWRWSAETGLLVNCSTGDPIGTPWSWRQCLESTGLTRTQA